MLMVIFGAGASYDSVPGRDWSTSQSVSEFRPPLAAELFSKRSPFDDALKDFWRCAGLVGELRNAVARGKAVEESLQLYAGFAEEGDAHISRQLLALRFYLDRIVAGCGANWIALSAGVTNFAVLTNQIELRRVKSEQPVLFVTFNYDYMLEDGLQRTLGLRFKEVGDYVAGDRPYRVVKPHGSVSWRRLVRRDPATDVEALIADADTLDFTDLYVTSTASVDRASIPAIAVPTLSKSLFECPNDHIAALKDMLSEVDRLLVIGWRAQEQEFLQILRKTVKPSKLQGVVVSSDHASAERIVPTLAAALPEALLIPADVRGFSEFVLTDDWVNRLWHRKL